MGTDQRRAILAVVVSGIILFGWQYFFAPPVTNAPVVKTDVTNINSSEENDKISKNVIKSETDSKNIEVSSELSTFSLKNSQYEYSFNNNLTLVDVISNADKSFSSIFTSKNNNQLLFLVNGEYKKLFFTVSKNSDSEAILTNNELGINGSVKVDDKGFLHFNLNSSNAFNYKFQLKETTEELEGGKTKQFLFLSDDLSTVTVGDDDKTDKEIKWFGMDFNYHLFATVVEKKPYLIDIKESGLFNIKFNQAVNSLDFKQIYAKKEYDYLTNLGNHLELSVDFGIWSIIAVPILRGLQFFFSIIPNYGISIIILTILIRTLTFPLQFKSFKSMKKMQEIQPELTKLREKFKDDPQRMQKETMALFKKAGTNPIGGCLPMILQMPIFFAFYRVLYSAVELVDAPFYFWITDLSEKDPYYVLPVLMALAMFFHQKLTPTASMDTTQKKIMLFMPLIFAVFMKDFPAGLTLYIFVSTVIAMLQQLFVFKRT